MHCPQFGQGTPIRPLHGFKLEFSTILGSFGLITTYAIVLLQFKIGERSLHLDGSFSNQNPGGNPKKEI